MLIELRLFHGLHKYLSHGDERYSQHLEIPLGTTAEEVLASLGLPKKEGIVIFVNGMSAKWEYVLNPGDVIAAMLPAGGG